MYFMRAIIVCAAVVGMAACVPALADDSKQPTPAPTSSSSPQTPTEKGSTILDEVPDCDATHQIESIGKQYASDPKSRAIAIEQQFRACADALASTPLADKFQAVYASDQLNRQKVGKLSKVLSKVVGVLCTAATSASTVATTVSGTINANQIGQKNTWTYVGAGLTFAGSVCTSLAAAKGAEIVSGETLSPSSEQTIHSVDVRQVTTAQYAQPWRSAAPLQTRVENTLAASEELRIPIKIENCNKAHSPKNHCEVTTVYLLEPSNSRGDVQIVRP